jgi:ubiquinone/menaquinone biosynthesis C-methylase UbiE
MSGLAFWRRNRAKDDQKERSPRTRRFGGRHYMGGVPYILPSDDGEINRLDFQHYMLRYALQGNYAAARRQPASILDVACGTGRWCTEMATHFPKAHVIGFDITPPPVTTADAPHPGNFRFVQGNMLEGLPFPDNSFDVVHQRLVIVALPTAQWVRQIQELLRVTRPGGWIELVEGDLLPGGPGVQAYRRTGVQALNGLGETMSQKRGMSFGNASRISDYLRQAGAHSVAQRVVRIPVGKRTGRLGAMAETDYLAILTSVRAFLIAQGLITEEQHNQALARAREELASGRLNWPFYIAYGQK